MQTSIALPAKYQLKTPPCSNFVAVLLAMVVALVFSLAHAGTDTTAVDDVWDQLSGWAKALLVRSSPCCPSCPPSGSAS